MPAIFISHSSRDPKPARDMQTMLAKLGFDQVFLDFDKHSGIGAGESWEKRLHDELARCHAVILVLTPNWLESKWCFAELVQARSLGKVVLPVICAPLGDQRVLAEIQAVDLLDWNTEGLDRIAIKLRAITDRLARGFAFDPKRPPYPGINAFESEDAAIYFGRDEETRAVLERLEARRTSGGARLQMIIGASGVGKSSLMKAGVLPQIARQRAHWRVLPLLRPEKTPLEAVAKTIAHQLSTPYDWRAWHTKLSARTAATDVENLLKDLRVGDARAATVLLPIDQFEEVFTVATAEERTAFLALLAAVFDPARDLPIMALATGRSDLLDGLIEWGGVAYETLPLGPMPLERVPLLVEGPASVASIGVDIGLAERMTRDLERPEALPLLAYMLWLLHKIGATDRRLSVAEYDTLGDQERGLNPIQNSVRLAAERALQGLAPPATGAELAALREAFVLHLVRIRIDDDRNMRQPAKLADLPPESRRLVWALTESRLLVSREGTVEVAHEALFKAWPTLEKWLTEEHAFLIDSERLRAALDVWSEAKNEQKPGALLHGLLLARAREWKTKHAVAFARGALKPVGDFIALSAAAEDAARSRELLAAQALLAEKTRAATASEALLRQRASALRWYRRAAVVAVVLLSFAVTGWLTARSQERAANYQSALLKIDRADILVDEGSVEEGLLLLLESAKFFDDETAPDSLRIGLTRALEKKAGREVVTLFPNMQVFTTEQALLLLDPATNDIHELADTFPPVRVHAGNKHDSPIEFLGLQSTSRNIVAVRQDGSIEVVDRTQKSSRAIGSFVMPERGIPRGFSLLTEDVIGLSYFDLATDQDAMQIVNLRTSVTMMGSVPGGADRYTQSDGVLYAVGPMGLWRLVPTGLQFSWQNVAHDDDARSHLLQHPCKEPDALLASVPFDADCQRAGDTLLITRKWWSSAGLTRIDQVVRNGLDIADVKVRLSGEGAIGRQQTMWTGLNDAGDVGVLVGRRAFVLSAADDFEVSLSHSHPTTPVVARFIEGRRLVVVEPGIGRLIAYDYGHEKKFIGWDEVIPIGWRKVTPDYIPQPLDQRGCYGSVSEPFATNNAFGYRLDDVGVTLFLKARGRTVEKTLSERECFAFSPDGSRLMIWELDAASPIQMYNVSDVQAAGAFEGVNPTRIPAGRIYSASFAGATEDVLTTGSSTRIVRWRRDGAETFRATTEFVGDYPIFGASMNASGDLLVKALGPDSFVINSFHSPKAKHPWFRIDRGYKAWDGIMLKDGNVLIDPTGGTAMAFQKPTLSELVGAVREWFERDCQRHIRGDFCVQIR